LGAPQSFPPPPLPVARPDNGNGYNNFQSPLFKSSVTYLPNLNPLTVLIFGTKSLSQHELKNMKFKNLPRSSNLV
jgi:hypothetical protein